MGRIVWGAAFAAMVGFLLDVVPPATAQYLYLDADGDSVHTGADVLSAAGTTTVSVWLITDRNRDGSIAICSVDPTTPLTINSYEVILRAFGGRVVWGTIHNEVPSATTSFGHAQDDRDLYFGFGGGEILPPGRYHLATAEVTPAFGTPSLLVTGASNVHPVGFTSFGCYCLGLDQDNTLKLGADWFDADGLPAAGAPTAVIDPIADQMLREGEYRTVPLRAEHAGGATLSASLSPALPFVALRVDKSEPGLLTGAISFRPLLDDSGSYRLSVIVTDGTRAATEEIGVRVVDVPDLPPPPPPPPPPGTRPVLSWVPDLGVQPGLVRNWAVWATASDSLVCPIEVLGGPAFVTLENIVERPGRSDAILRLAPSPTDAGTWALALRASNGTSDDIRPFRMTVGPNHPPEIALSGAVAAFEGESLHVAVRVTDADYDSVHVEVTGAPRFAEDGGGADGMGSIWREITVRPGTGDAGEYSIEVTATDGFGVARRVLATSVFAPGTREASWTVPGQRCLEPGYTRYWGGTVHTASGEPLRTEMVSGPAWITADASSPNAILLTATPGATTATGWYAALLSATAPDGGESRWILSLALINPGGCYIDGGILASVGYGSPTAVAGGPYRGYAGAPARFDGRWSKDGTAPVGYRWDFGDGATAYGAVADHRYTAPGAYPVVLYVANINGWSRDTTEAVISAPIPASVSLWPGQRVVPLRESSATLSLYVEPADVPFDLGSLRPETATLRAAGMGETDSIAADPSAEPTAGDVNHDGVPDAAVTFRVADLRRLFTSVVGMREVGARLELFTTSGEFVRGDVSLQVLGAPGKEIAVGPNPFNPTGWIRFEVEERQLVRVRLFDVAGRLVRTLLEQRAGTPGPRAVLLDGRDARGQPLASGVYFYRVERGSRVDRGRVTILK